MTTKPPAPQQHALTLIDIVGRVCVLGGAIVGSWWGWVGFGIMGAIPGIPIGAMMGLAFTVTFVVMGLIFAACAGSAGAYLRGGRKGFHDYWQDNTTSATPPATTATGKSGTNSPNEAGR